MAQKLFPDDFLWGASTAGHQVEGGNYDQWTVWELAHAAELAETAADRLRWMPDWLRFKAEAEKPSNYVSGKGVDHFSRYKEDFDILKKIGLNAFRFGIEWSRIEPERGVWDKKAIDHYHNYLHELKKRGIEPVINLWHWTHPVWFEELGGWTVSENLRHFERFVQKIADEFGQDVTYILTVNEPNNYMALSHLTGEWPPQSRNPIKALWVFRNLAKAHNKAYDILKAANPDLMVGPATQFNNAMPKRPGHWLDTKVAKVVDYIWNWWFVNRIKGKIDFIGFNYYFTQYFQNFKQVNPPTPTNDLGWYMEPAGLAEIIAKTWLKYHKPIMITENGVADASDKYRQWWLKETMQALITSRKSGIDIIGYLHWSLLDNFEWKYGWWPKFGLVAVDRENDMKRTVRPSTVWWAKQLAVLKKAQR
jgi:beta-glucosidase